MEPLMIAVMIVFPIVSIFFLVSICRVVYIAFFARKDERMKMIVTKSMAQAFVIIFVLQVIQIVLKLVLLDNYEIWWTNFKGGLYIEPAMLSLIILGITLFFNKRKFSASE